MNKILVITLLAISVCIGNKEEEKPMKIVYVYDALCGWCYGFSPVMEDFYYRYKDEVDFEVISGGMIKGNRIGPIGEVAPYIKHAYKDVEERTGVKFGQAFLKDVLEEGSTVFTSIPAAVALSVFKSEKPDKALLFAKRIQKAIYYDGIDPSNNEAYGRIAEEFGFNKKSFVDKMETARFLEKAKEDFHQAALMGVRGFPTVFLMKGGLRVALTRGYTDYNDLQKAYKKAKKELSQ